VTVHVELTPTPTPAVALAVSVGGVNNPISIVKDYVTDVADLPTHAVNDMVLKVRNTQDAEEDDYWVKFEPSLRGANGSGTWVETHGPGAYTTLDPDTMPHALVREAGGWFTFKALDPALGGELEQYWSRRECGDDVTNPEPSFVGQGVENMFLFKNRLGFLSGDSIVMSRPGEYFNFWANSAIAISDSDPIDISASTVRPTTLRSAIAVPSGLLVFSDDTQFLLSSDEAAFSTATARITEISQFECRSTARPEQPREIRSDVVERGDKYEVVSELPGLDKADIEALAKLPSREVLLQQAFGILYSLLSGLVYTLKGNINKLVYTLEDLKKKKTV